MRTFRGLMILVACGAVAVLGACTGAGSGDCSTETGEQVGQVIEVNDDDLLYPLELINEIWGALNPGTTPDPRSPQGEAAAGVLSGIMSAGVAGLVSVEICDGEIVPAVVEDTDVMQQIRSTGTAQVRIELLAGSETWPGVTSTKGVWKVVEVTEGLG